MRVPAAVLADQRLLRRYLPAPPDGAAETTHPAEVIIYFADGKCWRSGENRDVTLKPDAGLTEFLAKKIGIPLEHTKTEDDFRVQSR